MTTALPMPTPTVEMAGRAMRQVDYDHHIVGLKMAAMGGANPSALYSLEDVAEFIHVDDYETALRDNHATVGYIDPMALASWIEDVLGDADLAAAIREVAGDGAVYGSIAPEIKDLILQRAGQLREALSETGQDEQ